MHGIGVSERWSASIRSGKVSGMENGDGCAGTTAGSGGRLLTYEVLLVCDLDQCLLVGNYL